MRSNNDLPDREESGLSTDDLAQASADTGATGAGEEPEVPTYPGEATGTAYGEGEATETAYGEAEEPTEAQAGEPAEEGAPEEEPEEEAPALLSEEDEQGFRERWQEIQSRFVDDPRDAVHAADSLVADVIQNLAATFAQHKQDLEGQWSQGEQVDTENLRKALRRYRSFFNRLLST
ncbi:hypothetical protein ACSNOH_00025 [Streptomyces sp. URMC 127]|uniref:hypothetical protein n=1 Tax=Streptomyces sp. URMC 127 TaxID=3423402 RepID=UPI003F1ABA50